jgi:hypothetical protein
MIEIYYLKPTIENIVRLNQIIMNNYVFKNGKYINDYDSGTVNYYDTEDQLQLVTTLLESAVNDVNLSQNDRDFIAQMLLTKKTRSQWIAAGEINPIPPVVPQGS